MFQSFQTTDYAYKTVAQARAFSDDILLVSCGEIALQNMPKIVFCYSVIQY